MSTEVAEAARNADVSIEVLREWAEQILREAGGESVERGPEVVERVLMPALRSRLDKQLDTGTTEFRPVLSGLAELAPEPSFRTKAEHQLAALMSRSAGGTIGIAGPPGIGKTSLMLVACHGRLIASTPEPPIGISTTIHDDTTTRDLVLDLLERLCRAVLGDAYARDDGAAAPPPAGLRPESPTTWLLVLVVGAALLVLAALDVTLDAVTSAGIALVAVGALGYATTVTVRHHRDRGNVTSLGERAAAVLDMVIAEQRFETTITSGWSVAAKPPIGLEGGRTGGMSRKQLPLEFRHLVQPFRDFVDQLGLTSHVVIGLDGLDRRDSGENIRRFLQDITPLMGVPGCFFLVTLPEPLGGVAARRRLYLDDVVRMDRLDLRTAAEMVQSRVAGVPKRFAALCYCLSGGVPSDLIRTVRDLVDLHTREGSAALPDVASRLIEEELGYLSAELRMAALGADWDQQSEVDAWVERLARIDASAGSLLETCRGLRSSSSVMKSGGGSTATSLGGLMRRALGLCYVDATLLEIFGQQPSGFTLDDILEAQPPDPSLETLTEARNLLDRGAYATGWRFVSVFREGWGLKVLSAPFADCRDPE